MATVAMVLSDEIAVMHEGRVLQVAPPETIYTRPANRTVAAFVGTPNLLDAKARDPRSAPGATLARVEGEGWTGWCSAPDDLQSGEMVRFFRGTRNLYTLQVGIRTVSVDAPPDQAVAPGATVTLTVEALHTWAVRADPRHDLGRDRCEIAASCRGSTDVVSGPVTQRVVTAPASVTSQSPSVTQRVAGARRGVVFR